jgi:hypothetical protein
MSCRAQSAVDISQERSKQPVNYPVRSLNRPLRLSTIPRQSSIRIILLRLSHTPRSCRRPSRRSSSRWCPLHVVHVVRFLITAGAALPVAPRLVKVSRHVAVGGSVLCLLLLLLGVWVLLLLLLVLLLVVVVDGFEALAGDGEEGAVFDAGFDEAHCDGWRSEVAWCGILDRVVCGADGDGRLCFCEG